MYNITAALIKGMDVDRAVNREVLLAAVQTAIFCKLTGRVLDVKSTVLFTVSGPEVGRAAAVVTADAWDGVKDAIQESTAEKGLKLEVLDGRELYS